MAVNEHIEIRGFWCDKRGCDRSLTASDSEPPEAAYVNGDVKAWMKLHGWSLWVGRGQWHYCPEHGPSKASKMRRIV